VSSAGDLQPRYTVNTHHPQQPPVYLSQRASASAMLVDLPARVCCAPVIAATPQHKSAYGDDADQHEG